MIDTTELFSLPATEKIRIVEMLWDNLANSNDPIPLPDWADREAARRRDELRDLSISLTHDETWRRIAQRNG